MKLLLALYLIIGLGCIALAKTQPAAQPDSIAPPAAPKIEVCFVLDTTGSMGGLIEAAKQKIWSISNQIVRAKPTPQLKIGLVAYRDRGDEYLTKPFALTDDIDRVYAHLMELKADGGGDEPESVNEALAVAVHKMAWSPDDRVLKIIFLVGDAPPHMDYDNDVRYPTTCQEAARRGITINAVQCGNSTSTQEEWQKIAKLAEGRYIAIAQDGAVAVIPSPMDDKLAQLNAQMGKTLVPYGRAEDRDEVHAKQALSEKAYASADSAPAASDRLAYNMATGKAVQGSHELVSDYGDKPAVLKTVKADELPAELKDKSPAELEAYLKDQLAARQALQKQIVELGREREAYLAEERKKLSGKKDGFDEQVATMLREEAGKKGLHFD